MKNRQPLHSEHSPKLIWDLPSRVFHWLLVACFITAWITHESDRFLYHHVFAGYLFFGLLIFRFVWGFIGSHYARFRSFAHDWKSVTEYLKALLDGSASRYIGHNPAGSWAIFMMLALGILIAISGMLVLGGEEGHGPLKGLISFDVGSFAKEAHETLAALMLLVVFVHVGGVIVESIYHKENLIWSMIVGHKPAPDDTHHVHLYPLLGVILLGIALTSAIVYFRGYVTQTADAPFLAFKHEPLVMNDTWQSECSECHLAFHPSLLPAKSWQSLFAQQNEHFGDDLALDEDTVNALLQYALDNSSEKGATEPAHKITRSVGNGPYPIRITAVEYWKHKHHEIADSMWRSSKVKSKANCAACHLDAKQGWFEDSNMRLPKLEEKVGNK
ncbi:MAG: cytochrome b/b6 domain-containing protein [Gammaproteobacteria bacterium]|nr:cytochrome b/b6 domain-containing protein [Gammaproteobacteria bacterium]